MIRTSPWVRRTLTREQYNDLDRRVPEGATLELLASNAGKAPYLAKLMGPGFDGLMDRRTGPTAHAAASKLLDSINDDGVRIECAMCHRTIRGEMSVRVSLDGDIALVCFVCFESGDEGGD